MEAVAKRVLAFHQHANILPRHRPERWVMDGQHHLTHLIRFGIGDALAGANDRVAGIAVSLFVGISHKILSQKISRRGAPMCAPGVVKS